MFSSLYSIVLYVFTVRGKKKNIASYEDTRRPSAMVYSVGISCDLVNTAAVPFSLD